MHQFADGDVGLSIFKAMEGAEQSSKLLFYGIIIFGLLIVALTVTMLLLRRKFGKTKNKNYLNLP